MAVSAGTCCSAMVEEQGKDQQRCMARRDDPESLVAWFGGGLELLDDAAGNDAGQVDVALAKIKIVEADSDESVADGFALNPVERAVFAGLGDEPGAQCRGAAEQFGHASLSGNEGAHQAGDLVADQWLELVVEQGEERESKRDLVGQHETDGWQGQAAEEQGTGLRFLSGRCFPVRAWGAAEQLQRYEQADGGQQQTATRDQ